MYPDKIGVVAFKDGSYEVDTDTPSAAPNVTYYNKNLVSGLISALENLEIAATGCGVPHPQERKILHESILEARNELSKSSVFK